MIYKKNIKNIDFILIFLVFLLSIIGFLFIYSASFNMPNFLNVFVKQIFILLIGYVCIIVFSQINYNFYYKTSIFFYFISLFLLFLVLFFGIRIKGAKSWFNLKIILFQPIEIARVSLILFLSKFLDKNIAKIKTFKILFYIFLIVLPLIILVGAQPDLGGILVLVPIILGLCFIAGVRKIYIFSIILFTILCSSVVLLKIFFVYKNWNFIDFNNLELFLFLGVGVLLFYYIFVNIFDIKVNKLYCFYFSVLSYISLVLGNFVYHHLKPYQKNRLLVFFDPYIDRLGAGYNIIQSNIAIGSGFFEGKGFKKGTQGQLGFVPERHTDFIFSVIGEEGGFLLSFLTILIYILFCYRIYLIALNAKDRFASFLAISFLIYFGFFIFLNIGCAIGFIPITGVPLPFISYGGSSFVINSIIVGILLNISKERYVN